MRAGRAASRRRWPRAGLADESWPGRLSAPVAASLAYHIVIATAFAYVLWYRLLDSATATVSSLTALAVPVVGVLGAMWLVGDQPSYPATPALDVASWEDLKNICTQTTDAEAKEPSK